ncbi:hypothetical protein FACS18949_17010 [Clostridia bacterium]|nr:hypothetical protein FACS18949_17010 [Clostridia bacterium]
MTKQQEYRVEHIRDHIIQNDCFKNSPDYEIKTFEVCETDYGSVEVYAISGIKGDSGTAAVYARTKRQIFIGKRGEVKAYPYNDGKSRRLKGWGDVMTFGYYHQREINHAYN